MAGFAVSHELWATAGQRYEITSADLAAEVDKFCMAMNSQPFGSDDLGTGLFEGTSCGPGFVRRRDELLTDLAAAVNLLRCMGAGLLDAAGCYIEADGTVVDQLLGQHASAAQPTARGGVQAYALPRTPTAMPSTVTPPGLVKQAEWFFERVGVGCSYPDGDLDKVGQLVQAALTMAYALVRATEDAAAHASLVTGSGWGDATAAFDHAADTVHGEAGLLGDLLRRCDELGMYCQAAHDAIAKGQRQYHVSAIFVVALIGTVFMLGPLLAAGLETALSLIRLEGLALQILTRALLGGVIGATYSGGLKVIDQLVHTGHVDLGALGGALLRGGLTGAMMGVGGKGLAMVPRGGPALTGLADAIESPGLKGMILRLVSRGSVATGTTFLSAGMTGRRPNLKSAAETGFGMALIGTVGGAFTDGGYTVADDMPQESP